MGCSLSVGLVAMSKTITRLVLYFVPWPAQKFVLRSSPARVRRWAASRSAQWPGLGIRPGTFRSDPARSDPAGRRGPV